MKSAETSSTTRRIDPAADIWEAHEQWEAARLKKAEADKAEAAALKKLAEAEATDAENKLLKKSHTASRRCSSSL